MRGDHYVLFLPCFVLLFSLFFFGGGFATHAANAVVHQVGPDQYLAAIRALPPGQELHLSPGEYLHGLPVQFINGTADAPIVISGPAIGLGARFVARAGHNTVSIRDASHVVLRNLILDGRGAPVDAVKCEGDAQWAHHITLENLTIVGHGAHQQIVGISTKCPAWNWVVRGNIIEGAGTGMYFGDSDGSAPFVAGLIEHNLVTDTLGYSLQIKHQQERPAVAGMPVTPQVTIIRHNVFSKGQNSSRDDLARPNVLVGHWPLRGSGRADRYLVYGNFFYQNPSESLFQGEGRIALYHNLMLNDYGDALRIQPHHDRPRDIQIFFNTIVAKNSGVTVLRRADDPKAELQVVGNVVLAARPVRGYTPLSNIVDDYTAARNLLVAPTMAPPRLDLHLRQTALLPLDTPIAHRNQLPDFAKDFDGRPRQPGLSGAYGEARVMSDWPPQLALKPSQP